MVPVKFAKLHPEAVIPRFAKPGDAGMDITAVSCRYVPRHEDGGYFECKTGLSVEIPEGYVALLFPRSSISKTDLSLSNSVGVLDSGYRGEIMARFKIVGDHYAAQLYQPGDRVIQMVIMKLPEVEICEVSPENLSKTERGTGGFGHTGK